MIDLRKCKTRQEALLLVDKYFPPQSQRIAEAVHLLVKELGRGRVLKSRMIIKAQRLNISSRTLARAAVEVRVVSVIKGWGKNRRAYWTLPHVKK